MKNPLFAVGLFICLGSATAHAQLPQGINYQAVARNAAGLALANETIGVRISIINGTPLSTPEYTETFTVTTNDLGLFDLVVGQGNAVSGTFAAIDWSTGTKFMKLDMDATGGTNYATLGTTQLLAVPFAFVAQTALSAPTDGWGTQAVVAGAGLSGNGTAANPLDMAPQGAAAGQVLTFNGTSWAPQNIPPQADNWGTQTVVADATLGGIGTAANPLGLANQGATTGQVLKWNGTAWLPANDDISFTGGPLQVSARISGNGTLGSPLDIAGQSAATGQTLKWNGASWAPAADLDTDAQSLSLAGTTLSISGGNNLNLASINTDAQSLSLAGQTLSISGGNSVILPTGADNWGTQTAIASGAIAGNGTAANALRLANGAAVGQVWQWNGTAWVLATLPTYTAGNGISLAGNTIANTVWTVAGSNIHRTLGNVGIGTATPFGALQVSRAGSLTNPQLSLMETNAGSFSLLSFDNAGASNEFWAIGGRPTTNNTGRLNFFSSLGASGIDVMSLTMDGRVGIGTTNPLVQTALDVVSPRRTAGIFESDSVSANTSSLIGVYQSGGNVNAIGVYGQSFGNAGHGLGGEFQGGSIGLSGYGNGFNYTGNYAIVGVFGDATATASHVGSNCIGVYGVANGNTESNWSVYGFQQNTVPGFDYAAVFDGNMDVAGSISKLGGTFRIDHPLDPANQFLVHSFVESPDMMNIYNGNTTTDANGLAVVEMPRYFEALNREFRYQLTVIGTFAQAIVKEEISGNTFSIQTSLPNIKVSWQVTGVRRDPWAEANRVQAEVPKTGSQRGRYLAPELYGQPADLHLYHSARTRATGTPPSHGQPRLPVDGTTRTGVGATPAARIGEANRQHPAQP